VTFELIGGETYNIEEDLPANWALTDVTCDGDVNYRTNGVFVNLGYEDDVTCTFTNEPDCTDPGADLVGTISDDGTMGWVTNHSTALCTWEIGMASYEKYDDVIDNQVLFDYIDGVPVAPGETVKVEVELPECAVQVDLFYGPYLASLNGQRYKERLLDYLHIPGTGYCGSVPSANSVSGYIVMNGQGMPGVMVTLTSNNADGLVVQAETNVDGFYGFEGLPAGDYHLQLSGDALNSVSMDTTEAMVTVSAAAPAVANFEGESATPTAVTVSSVGTLAQTSSALLISLVTFLLAAATAFIWRKRAIG
jgi:hypothetical protein